MTIPTYHDNKPANIQAAIIDAMFWLRWLRSCLNDERLPAAEWSEHRARLREAIRALEQFLPDEAPEAGY